MFRFGDDKQSFTCSFCGKKQEQVRRMIAGPGVYICSDCVDMCKDIIAEELSKDEAEGDGKKLWTFSTATLLVKKRLKKFFR